MPAHHESDESVKAPLRRTRLRRSVLSTPGSKPEMIAKAAASDADVVFVDLEDAVAPGQKVAARATAVEALMTREWGRTARAVRINDTSTEWCHDDLIDIVTGAGEVLDVIIVPKVRSPRDVWFVDDLLTQLELKLRLPGGRIGLEVLVEEVEAVQNVDEIARASSRLEAITLGVGDLAASQGMRLGHIGAANSGYLGDIWHYARHRLVIAARSAGVEPIDGPHSDFRDLEGLERSAASFAALGGGGKWCIHPAQIEVLNRMFAPTTEEIDEARAVVAAMEDAIARGDGAANLDGVMIDAASARAFERRLERARLCGLL